jgi:hypothetical protein
VRNFGDGVCCFLRGDHSHFHLSRFIMLRIDQCGKALYVFYVVITLGLLSIDVFFGVLLFLMGFLFLPWFLYVRVSACFSYLCVVQSWLL